MPLTRVQAASAPGAAANLRASLGLALIILFFVATGLLATLNINVLRDGSAKVQHTHTVITALDGLVGTLKDAETGQRGYLLTGRQQYLSPYESAVIQVAAALDRVETLTRDNPIQQERMVTLRRLTHAKLAELKETVDLRRGGNVADALGMVESDRGKADMDAIRAQLELMQQEEGRLRQVRIDEMNAAYRTAWLTGIVAGGLGIALTLVVGYLLRRSTAARERLQWQQAGQARMAEAMLGDPNESDLGAKILGFLADYLGAQGGAIYAAQGATYRLVAKQGVPAETAIVQRFTPSEGLLGKAATQRKAILLSDVPDGYLTIGSAFGQDKPRHLIVAPAIADDMVQGVFELGFFQPVDDAVLEFLGQASVSIAMALRSARFRAELQALLEETQRQSEELQAQSEELRVSNEELEEQGRALKESQVRLEQQQVELEQTNAQLEEQAQQLETQRDDLVRSNAAVELKARELDRASQYKSDFLANMSHELRTPLNSLLILSKLLGDNPGGNLTAEQVKYAETIHGSGADLLLLINDILDLSKIEAGHVEVRPEAVSLQRLAGDMRQLFQPLAQDRGLDLTVSLTEGLPETIETDRQRLDQILKNLLSNALKFTEQGGVSLTMAPVAGGKLTLAVTDTGIGIADDQQQEIFEAFRQADGTISRKYGGTGLGLSISRELARLLGGSIALASTAGEGSTFTLTIPAAYDPAQVAQRPEPIAARAPGAIPPAPVSAPVEVAARSAGPLARPVDDDRDLLDGGDRILLVVEDDSSFAEIVRDLAREMGFRCLVAGRAEEALDLARRFKPSAVVLDVGLPDQSGLAVLDRLKSEVETRHIPVHVVSANDHTQTALSLGAIGYLVKPVKREDLAGVLEALAAKLSQTARRVLIVEDDAVQRDAVARLLATGDVDTVAVGTAAECLARLREETFDCMVLDLSLPDASGFSLLEQIQADASHGFPPVIVYTGRDLSADEEQQLRRYSDSIIIKGARSPERLLDEVSLFLHQVVTDLPPEQQKMIQQARNRDAILEGRRVLVVEDDVRNVYSLTNILEPRGAQVSIARNGREAIEALQRSAAEGGGEPIDLVLMDVMMPVMDGLAATREIRQDPRWQKLPIIALTAKAMPDDQRRCIEAGASDYMAKPLDVDKLLSLVRVWMPR